MKSAWALAGAAAILAAKLLGLFTFGFVASGSMEPSLQKGSLFLAFQDEPGIGDVVVFSVQGERVVHRVVAIRDDGLLVTKGDANALDDVESGLGPVDPRGTHVVPSVAGTLVATDSRWAGPVAVALLQVTMLTIGLRGLARNPRRRPSRLKPHHALLAAAAILLASAPLFHDTVDAASHVGVRASLLPIVASVSSEAAESSMVAVDAFAETTAAAEGAARVVYAPALPGARLLLPFGATAAVLPAVGLLLALAGVIRMVG